MISNALSLLRRVSFIAALAAFLSSQALAVSPTKFEIAQIREFVSYELFSFGDKPDLGNEAGLHVVRSYWPVERNGWLGQPFSIRGAQFTSGLYAHAPSKITVRLPSAGRSFKAIVGVDSNNQTSGGQGSVKFIVRAGGKEACSSSVLKEGMAGEAVEAKLAGATAFELEVTDAGDGIACDQAVWANARAELENGKTLHLGDMPITGGVSPMKADTSRLPFSFVYDGKDSSEFLKTWKTQQETKQLDHERTQTTTTFTDPRTGMAVQCVGVAYRDYPTVEWTLYFKNNGKTDSPILEKIQPLNLRVTPLSDPNFEYRLHHNRGTVVTTINVPAGRSDFEPLVTPLGPKANVSFEPPQGRPCAGDFPYFNVESVDGGLIAVVGWPGAWSARFARDEAGGLQITGGQRTCHFSLHPGEEVRSPLVVIESYRGDWIRGQNIWRRWMTDHNLPRPGGKPIEPMTAGFCGYYSPGELIITEQSEKLFMHRYKDERLLPDCWWVDAGWYQMTNFKGLTSYINVGTWETDNKRFPNGLRSVFDESRSLGIAKGVLWFEPERVTADSWLFENRPQWLLGGRDWTTKLFNFGNAEARRWMVDRVDAIMKDARITIYREDFNFPPIGCWEVNEPENRRGINENHHVVGHLAFWDELLKRDPRRLIDTCASGGHRLDLETLRRSVPLWRTDRPFEPIGTQGQTYGLSLWEPYHGTGVVSDDPYTVRSNMAPFFLMSWDMRRKDLNYDRLRALMTEWRRWAKFYLGDYYPLTNYTQDDTAWMAWQFDSPDQNAGMVQVFRRGQSPYETARFRLKSLTPQAKYVITNAETGSSITATGEALMARGLSITMKERPGGQTLVYVKQ
ncbi:MAG: NPCBM/NEW2 domain-containing protein [Planctomycetaceae bacterium]|nr:NPCBM/NEW2 domain-containing protein [Planctomycetaceae bacterium]